MTEIEQLREEVAKLRERVAVLETTSIHYRHVGPIPPRSLGPTDEFEPRPWWTRPGVTMPVTC